MCVCVCVCVRMRMCVGDVELTRALRYQAWKSPCLLMFRCHESIAQAHDPSVEVPPAAVVPPSVFSLPPLAQRWTMGGALAYNARPVHGDGRMLDASLVRATRTWWLVWCVCQPVSPPPRACRCHRAAR